MGRVLAGMLLVFLAMVTVERQASAQDPVGGAIVGGALGGIIGGAVGHSPGGAIAGALIGATTGAVIASEAQRRNSGYYWWRGGCYYRYPNGSWLQVQPNYCAY
jgi:hypothetical protein